MKIEDANYLLLREILDRLSKDFDFKNAPFDVFNYAREAQVWLRAAIESYESDWRKDDDR